MTPQKRNLLLLLLLYYLPTCWQEILPNKTVLKVSQTPCPALQHPVEEQEGDRLGLNLVGATLPFQMPAQSPFLTSKHHWTHTTVSWRYFDCNLITMLIALNGVMMGNRHSEFEENITAVQSGCSHCVITVGGLQCSNSFFKLYRLNVS